MVEGKSLDESNIENAPGCIKYIFLFLVFVAISTLVSDCRGNAEKASKTQTAQASTPDPRMMAAIEVVKKYNPGYGPIEDSIEVARILSYRDGNLTEDRWTVSYEGDGFYFVRFYFFLNSKYYYAEWRYDSQLEIVKPTNEWGWTFFN